MRYKYKDLYEKALSDKKMFEYKYKLLTSLITKAIDNYHGDVNNAIEDFSEREQLMLNSILDEIHWE